MYIHIYIHKHVKLYTGTEYLLWFCYYCTWLFHMVIVLFIVCSVHEQSSMSIVGQTSPPCPSVCLFALLPPSEELNSLMAWGTKEFFSLFFGRSSLSLNWLLRLLMTVCRGWLVLTRIPCSLLRVLFRKSFTKYLKCTLKIPPNAPLSGEIPHFRRQTGVGHP